MWPNGDSTTFSTSVPGARLFVENPFVEYDCKSNTTLGRKKRPKATLGRIFL